MAAAETSDSLDTLATLPVAFNAALGEAHVMFAHFVSSRLRLWAPVWCTWDSWTPRARTHRPACDDLRAPPLPETLPYAVAATSNVPPSAVHGPQRLVSSCSCVRSGGRKLARCLCDCLLFLLAGGALDVNSAFTLSSGTQQELHRCVDAAVDAAIATVVVRRSSAGLN